MQARKTYTGGGVGMGDCSPLTTHSGSATEYREYPARWGCLYLVWLFHCLEYLMIYQDLLEINKDNSMKFWNTINEILGSDPTVKITNVFHYNTNILCSESETANILNDFFASVGERVCENLASLNYIQLDDVTDSNLCEFPLMTVDAFQNIVSELNVNKPSGIPELSTKVLLEAMQAVPLLFIKMCNSSLITAKFPTTCKLAKITIIPKKEMRV